MAIATRRGFLLLALALTACGPPWKVVVQSVPNPMLHQTKFAVLPVDFNGLIVGEKSEAEWLAGKDDEQRTNFGGDKAALNERFTNALLEASREEGLDVVLATGPGAAPFEVRPHIGFIEPGYYVGVSAAPSKVVMMVTITAPDGRVLDEIKLTHQTGASITVSSLRRVASTPMSGASSRSGRSSGPRSVNIVSPGRVGRGRWLDAECRRRPGVAARATGRILDAASGAVTAVRAAQTGHLQPPAAADPKRHADPCHRRAGAADDPDSPVPARHSGLDRRRLPPPVASGRIRCSRPLNLVRCTPRRH